MSQTEQNRKNILAVIEGITTGQLLEAFDTYYADNCVMRENGVHDPNRVGKASNRAYEAYFVENATFHGVEVGAIVADGETTGYDMKMDFSMGGQRMQRHQWATQTWKDGKIVDEVFFYTN